jgi:hypothetical protein
MWRKAGHGPEKSRFAAAGRAKHRHELTRSHVEVDVVTAATALVPEPNETSTLRIRIAPRVPVKEEELLILQRRPDDAMACTSSRSV